LQIRKAGSVPFSNTLKLQGNLEEGFCRNEKRRDSFRRSAKNRLDLMTTGTNATIAQFDLTHEDYTDEFAVIQS
jgi:hypothetical protein